MAEIAWDWKSELGSGTTVTLAKGVPGAWALVSSHYGQGPWMLWEKHPTGWEALAPTVPLINFVTLTKSHPCRSHRVRMDMNRLSPRDMPHTLLAGLKLVGPPG